MSSRSSNIAGARRSLTRPTTSKRGFRTNTRPTTAQSQTRATRTKSYIDDPECVSLRDKLYENNDMSEIETSKLIILLSYLREHSQKSALDEDYKEAKRARDLALQVRSELTTRGTYRNNIESLRDETSERRRQFEDSWQEKRDTYEQETNKKRQDLSDKQAHDLRVFEKTWRERMPHKYRKPSARLLQMKQIEKSLALTGEIDQADFIHEQAQALTEAEQAAAQTQLSADYEQAYAKLLQKQEEETQLLEDTREHGRQLLEREYKRECGYMQNRESVVHTRCTNVAGKTHLSPTVASKPTSLPKGHGTALGTLLPPLIPPNDPEYVRQKKERKAAVAKQQREYQKRNAEQIMKQYEYTETEELNSNQPTPTKAPQRPTPVKSEQSTARKEEEEKTENVAQAEETDAEQKLHDVIGDVLKTE